MDSQSEGGTSLQVKDQDLPLTIDKIPLKPNSTSLVDKILEEPTQIRLERLSNMCHH